MSLETLSSFDPISLRQDMADVVKTNTRKLHLHYFIYNILHFRGVIYFGKFPFDNVRNDFQRFNEIFVEFRKET